MPAVAKKTVKLAKPKPKSILEKPKKQTIKKKEKTAEINAAKKLAKLKSSRAVSDKLNRAPVVRRQKAKHQFDPTRLNRGVLLIKNLPKGFFEKQLKKYFSQYGTVTRLRLARSERTGGSKGHAYIEFQYPEVAKVAAEAMDNYLMFRQRLKTVYIPPSEQDHDYFKQPVQFVKVKGGKTKLVTPKTVRAAKHVANINKPVPAEVQADRVERSKYKLKFLEKKLAKAGINLDLSGQLYEGGLVKSEPATNKKEKDVKNKKKQIEAKVEPPTAKKAQTKKVSKVGISAVDETILHETASAKSSSVSNKKVKETKNKKKAVEPEVVAPTAKKAQAKKSGKSVISPEVIEQSHAPAPVKTDSVGNKKAKEIKNKKKLVETEAEQPTAKKARTQKLGKPEISLEPAKSNSASNKKAKEVKNKKKPIKPEIEPVTPKKVRTNYVTAPTPEAVPQKTKNKKLQKKKVQ